MKPKLLILQGVPASGKTTFARSLDPTVWVRVNKDDIRRMFGGYMVGAVFDDRDKVVKMWREEGLLCPQVYYGDF